MDGLRYSVGDIIAFSMAGKIVEDEILWVRKDGGGGFYHTAMDHKLDDRSVIGKVCPQGGRIANPGYLDALESRAEETRQLLDAELLAVRQWGS